MTRSFSAALALAALFASPLAAQQARSLAASVPPASSAMAEAPTVHHIMTLAWTEIRLPRSVANAPTSSTQPVASARPQIFTLTWQDRVGGEVTPAIAAGSPQSCTVTVLITLPCSAQ